jgi:hypothetical protein
MPAGRFSNPVRRRLRPLKCDFELVAPEKNFPIEGPSHAKAAAPETGAILDSF